MVQGLSSKLGLPDLAKVGELIKKMPDARTIDRLIKLFDQIERVSKVAPDLTQVITLLNELNTIDIAKLKETEKLLKRVEGILQNAPAEIIELLKTLKE